MANKATNARRVRRAAAAIETHVRLAGDPHADELTHLVDLITDLMHWSDRYGVNFRNACLRAADHHREERAPNEETPTTT